MISRGTGCGRANAATDIADDADNDGRTEFEHVAFGESLIRHEAEDFGEEELSGNDVDEGGDGHGDDAEELHGEVNGAAAAGGDEHGDEDVHEQAAGEDGHGDAEGWRDAVADFGADGFESHVRATEIAPEHGGAFLVEDGV